jgi:hypothetical protein
MTTVSQSPNSDNTPATKSPFPARIMGRTHVVQRVFVAHEDISGGRRYELECAKLTGTEKYVHLDPRKELALYEAMLNLVPEIADLRENEAKNRYLVLAKQWEISYCLEPRAFKNGVRDVKVATNIRQIPPTKAFSVPSWATGEDDLKEFAADCNCVWFPGGFIDETLGMARSQWPDRKTCFDTVRAKQAETQPPQPREQPVNLDTVFPRDANGEPIGLEDTTVTPDDKKAIDKLNASLDELTVPAWSAVDEPEGKQQTPAFVHFRRELLIIDPKADTTTHILKALGEPLGPHIEAHGIALTCGKLQEYLNDLNDKTRNAPEPQGATKAPLPAIPVPGSISDAPEAAPVRSETMPQKEIVGMLKVYPVDFGSIYYKGIKFSVTLEAGGTFDQAIELMEEFAKHRELIAPNCLVAQQPANVTALPQVTPQLPTVAPTAQTNGTPGTPDGKGRVPGGVGSTVVTGVEVSKKNGKLTIELWGTGKYPEHSLKLDAEHAMITALGYSVEKMEIGTRYPINWTSDWVVSGNRANDGKGNYYLNVTGIRDNAVSVPKIA